MKRSLVVTAAILTAVVVYFALAADPAPPAPRPRAAARVGVSPGAGVGSMSDAELAADLARSVDAGVEWIRLDVAWSHVERWRGRHDWRDTDRLVGAARRSGLRVLGLLAYTPPWARPDGTTEHRPPTDPGDFARFAAEAAARYRDDVDAWEIWNEPNLGRYWRPAPDPAAYARLLDGAAAAIRRVDGATTVVSGGLAPAADDEDVELSPETFLRRMYRHLEPGTVDAVGIHPYSFPALPSSDADWNPFARLPTMRGLVERAAGRPTPLWLTEFGAPFDPDEPDRQADIVAEGVTCATQWDWLGPIFLFSTRDLPGSGTPLDFGLLAGDGSPRPAWRRLVAELAVAEGEPVVSACDAIEDPTA